MQKLGHHPVAGPASPAPALGGQLPHALARPPQGRFRIPTRHRFHQSLQIPLQARVPIDRFRPAPLRRIRCPRAGFGAVLSSTMPRITVPRDRPLARAIAAIPPKPIAWASAAATRRRVRWSGPEPGLRTCASNPGLTSIPVLNTLAASSIHFVTGPEPLARRTLLRRFVGVLRSWFHFFLVVNGLGEMQFAYLFGSD